MSNTGSFVINALAANIADGQWERLGLAKDEALKFLCHFVASLANKYQANVEATITAEYVGLRCMLMASLSGTKDIETIQQDAAFSNWGRENMIRLAQAYLTGGTDALDEANYAVFSVGFENRKPPQSLVCFEGDTGESKENAIVIRGAKRDSEGVAAEYWFLHFKFGRNFGSHIRDWEAIGQGLLRAEQETDRRYDVVTVRLPDASERNTFFDITDFYGKESEEEHVA